MILLTFKGESRNKSLFRFSVDGHIPCNILRKGTASEVKMTAEREQFSSVESLPLGSEDVGVALGRSFAVHGKLCGSTHLDTTLRPTWR
jgi:hypothetical protein